jgi:hypothetical protein
VRTHSDYTTDRLPADDHRRLLELLFGDDEPTSDEEAAR